MAETQPAGIGISKTDLELFEIARGKASSAEQRERIDALWRLHESLAQDEADALAAIRAAKAARGEEVRALTASEQEWLAEFTQDGGLDPGMRRWHEKLATPQEVLKSLAYGLKFTVHLRRGQLRHHHEADRPIAQRVIDGYDAAAEAFFDFIGDDAYRRKTCREIAELTIASNRSSCAVFPVFDIDLGDGDASTNGKSIGAAYDRLEAMAAERQLPALSTFLGFAERGSGDWFEPREGLRTVNALIDQVALPATKLKGKRALLVDLRELAAVLTAAEQRGARFHLEFDI